MMKMDASVKTCFPVGAGVAARPAPRALLLRRLDRSTKPPARKAGRCFSPTVPTVEATMWSALKNLSSAEHMNLPTSGTPEILYLKGQCLEGMGSRLEAASLYDT